MIVKVEVVGSDGPVWVNLNFVSQVSYTPSAKSVWIYFGSDPDFSYNLRHNCVENFLSAWEAYTKTHNSSTVKKESPIAKTVISSSILLMALSLLINAMSYAQGSIAGQMVAMMLMLTGYFGVDLSKRLLK
jgi:hypothetical protein